MNRRRLVFFSLCAGIAALLYLFGFYDQEETKIVVALPAGLAAATLVLAFFDEVIG